MRYYLNEKEEKLMNYIKLILIAIGLILAAMLAFSVIGIVYSALWYLFLLGVVAIGGTIGYKLLKKDDQHSQLEDKTPIVIAEMQNADRTLEEYKRKYLPK
jgi:4-hydroxybenzoate polyprenyltransferase